jgi:mannose-6-phosphate isomerase-like protein (cupin superfamily)
MRNTIKGLQLAAMIFAGCWCAQAATDSRSVEEIPSNAIDAAVAKTSDGSAFALLTHDPKTPVYVVRRDARGEVEVHLKLNDVIVVRQGSVQVLIGSTVKGNRQVKPNEWLGGKILDGKSYTLQAGDVIFIPAGLGHLMTPITGSVTYLVIKSEANIDSR